MARIVSVWAVASGSVCERVAREKSSNRSRSTTVRHTRCAFRSLRESRSTIATRSASSSSADRGLRPSARCDPIERRRRPTCTGRGSRLCASAWRCRPAARPSIRTSAASPNPATWPTVVMPWSRSLAAVTSPTPQSRSTGSGCRNSSSPSTGTTSRPSGFATPLATFARNFVRATPTVTGRPTRSRTSRRSRTAISVGRARDQPQPADVEERLVDRQALDERRRVVEHLEQRLARLAVGGHPRADDDRLRAQPASLRPPIGVRTPYALAS